MQYKFRYLITYTGQIPSDDYKPLMGFRHEGDLVKVFSLLEPPHYACWMLNEDGDGYVKHKLWHTDLEKRPARFK